MRNEQKQVKVELRSESGPTKLNDVPSIFMTYANLCNITVTPEEVILHFGIRDIEKAAKGINEGTGVAKVFLGLDHAKRFHEALGKTLEGHQGRMEGLLEEVRATLEREMQAKDQDKAGGESV